MVRMFLLIAAIGFALNVASRANAATPTVHYPAGWNMVGGPVGTDFSTAQTVNVYGGGTYTTPSSRLASSCTGYWAYFNIPTDVSMASSTTTSQSCALQSGWNMVGNPFNELALLPPNVAAQFWDSSSSTYVTVTHIPAGGAVWVYAAAAQSIALQPASQGEVTISAPPPPREPVQLHVGEYLTVLVPASDAGSLWDAHGDPASLRLAGSGVSPGSASYYYRWQAVAAGQTVVILDPACLKNGCKAPSYGVQVTILP